jgi:hypothetical protein
MDEEVIAMRRVAEAARALYEHERGIIEVASEGDIAQSIFWQKTQELTSTLNNDLREWIESEKS